MATLSIYTTGTGKADSQDRLIAIKNTQGPAPELLGMPSPIALMSYDDTFDPVSSGGGGDAPLTKGTSRVARHRGAVWSALVGFLLTALVMVPPIIQANADEAARDPSYQGHAL